MISENNHTPPTERLDFPEGWGEVFEKVPSVGEVWIFSGTSHCNMTWLPKLYFNIKNNK